MQKENKNNSDMTTAELDSHKMILVREIINHFNTEESLQKLAEACSIIRKEEESEAYHAIPEPLFQQLMDIAEEQIKTGQYLTDEELLEDMKSW